VCRLAILLCLSVLFIAGEAQPVKKEVKPYKVLSSGRQITIKSTKSIQSVMLWTTGGDRVIEQRDINSPSVTIELPISRRAFFLMVSLTNGKVYTEKIGVQ